jgi:formyltetrahydrofolate synthetase
MTDNEIINKWEKLLKIGHAPIGESWSIGGVVTTKLAKETFDMLKSQKAEIERLKDDKNRLEKMMDNLCKELDAEKNKNF